MFEELRIEAADLRKSMSRLESGAFRLAPMSTDWL